MEDKDIARLYSEYYPRSTFPESGWEPYSWQPSFSAWLAGKSSAYMYVPSNVRILDVGCGFGSALGYHRERRCSVHGTEMDENALRIAASQKLDIRHGPFNPSSWEAASFDYVTLDQVIEHSYEPLKLLRDVRAVLKPEGTLLMTTPNAASFMARMLGRRWINWHPPYHVILYTRAALLWLLDDAGFQPVWIKTVAPSAWMQYQCIHCALTKTEGEPSPFWDPRAARSLFLKEKLTMHIINCLSRMYVFAFATRLLDLLGAGDNLVVCARPKNS